MKNICGQVGQFQQVFKIQGEWPKLEFYFQLNFAFPSKDFFARDRKGEKFCSRIYIFFRIFDGSQFFEVSKTLLQCT